MFETFRRKFTKDQVLSPERSAHPTYSEVVDWTNLINEFGGSSFENGLYRVIRASDLGLWKSRIAGAFPEFGNRITCFGYDWLGRAFAIDSKRLEGGLPGVIMFEPGTGEALKMPCNIDSFHNEEIIEYRDAALASNFYNRWISNGGPPPQYGQCIGYLKPLFLDGVDELENLQVTDIDVYWHIMGQFIQKIKGMLPGTSINDQ